MVLQMEIINDILPEILLKNYKIFTLLSERTHTILSGKIFTVCRGSLFQNSNSLIEDIREINIFPLHLKMSRMIFIIYRCNTEICSKHNIKRIL